MSKEISHPSLFECADLLRTRRLSSVELVEALLRRIECYDGRLNSFVALYADQALDDARRCDKEIAGDGWRGPLHGIPYAAKDIIDVAGKQTSCHSRILLGNIADRDALVIERLRRAGAILIGKTALHEFATGGPSFDLPWPPARNPWNRAIHPGGSSSGSGSAVAAGFVPLALGTDTAGSIRHPATVCGVVGMKPTFAAISMAGCFPLSFSLDHLGPMTRGVHDNAIVLSCLVEERAAQRMQCSRASMEPFAQLHQGLENMRIGVIESFYRGVGADPQIEAATDAAVDALQAQGASVRPMRLSPLSMYTECGRTILQSEAFAVHADWLRSRPADYGTRGRRRLLAGSLISAERYVKAQQLRTHLAREFLVAMADIDVAVCASSLDFACEIDDPDKVDRTYDRQARTPFNLTGTPAISIPIGLSASGLPLGIQIVGKPYGEGAVYRAALALESALALPMHPSLDALCC